MRRHIRKDDVKTAVTKEPKTQLHIENKFISHITVQKGAVWDSRQLCSTWSIRDLGSYHIVDLPSLRDFSSIAVKAQSQVHLFQLIKRRTYPTS